jgi:hypothetical protein
MITDPLFADPDPDEYRLKPESPALGLAFQPIHLTKIDLRIKRQV